MLRLFCTRRSFVSLLIAVCFLGVIGEKPIGADADPSVFEDGLQAFSAGNYNKAIELFGEIGLDHEFAADALFWRGRSHMALEKYRDAADTFEQVIEDFTDHPVAEEAIYQLGRTRYLTSEYQKALQVFDRLLSEYPESDFLGNAYYWSGESLLALGHFQDARRLFQTVVEHYPRSFRVEAARYRMELIDLSRRERELLDLLRWSNEEQLRLSREVERVNQAYRQAIRYYRQLEAVEDRAETVDPGKLEELEAQQRELEERLEAVRLREEALELRESIEEETGNGS